MLVICFAQSAEKSYIRMTKLWADVDTSHTFFELTGPRGSIPSLVLLTILYLLITTLYSLLATKGYYC